MKLPLSRIEIKMADNEERFGTFLADYAALLEEYAVQREKGEKVAAFKVALAGLLKLIVRFTAPAKRKRFLAEVQPGRRRAWTGPVVKRKASKRPAQKNSPRRRKGGAR
jgi:hypothetical protein